MSKNKSPNKRIEFLAKKFDVFDDDDIENLGVFDDDIEKWPKNDYFSPDGVKYELLYDIDNRISPIYALFSFNKRKLMNEGIKVPKNIRVADFVFIDVVQADPTEHKEYVQWMLNTFTRLIKSNEFERALMFVKEDLWMASEYLAIFHEQKNKPMFKELCRSNQAFKNVSDPSNINQYRDLSHLFDAVDPYIVKNVGKLEKDLRNMVNLRAGAIPYEDRKVMVFNPLNVKSSRLFGGLTNWCTTGSKNSYDYYVNKKTPSNRKSKLYIVIFKTYFLPNGDPNKTDELYQLHFESEMYMDRKDKRISDISKLIEGNLGLGKFFYDTLFKMTIKGKDVSTKYVNALYNFGFTEILFNILSSNVKTVSFNGNKIEHLPDLARFNEVEMFYLYDVGLKDLHPSIGAAKTLKILSLPFNKLTKLPKSIGRLKKLEFLNLIGNNIEKLPEEMAELDESNGGSLKFLSVDKTLVSDVKRLLPNVDINKYGK